MIATTLSACVADTNKDCLVRQLKDNPVKWRKLARRATKIAEGWEMFRAGRGGVPATQILIAWWTDPLGRKHVVIRGWRIEDTLAREMLDRKAFEPLPSLLHAYPE
ncbi:MAG: hypothetical protein RMJ56_09690 [Gemmataceae bacterium]|nr:hypothetical protein [Gemmata sp.]MDW8197861.1 hypothetical protein [Gemmataceae bacterium]